MVIVGAVVSLTVKVPVAEEDCLQSSKTVKTTVVGVLQPEGTVVPEKLSSQVNKLVAVQASVAIRLAWLFNQVWN